MMIEVESLGKSYRLGGQQAVYRTFREDIVRLLSRPFRRPTRRRNGTFWALRDASFTVAEGEVVGVIGRNGAGKSTLLKLLSRITRPTEGRARLYGRVGSLLEVGTGFHPELSGRENIFLNGTVLGMRRYEVRRKFDEIVEFSEIGKFLDTPVKHYSSGMYVRLAFAVAAHLDPEILLVDEVLAVGDAAFQKKCLGKMTEAASGGRTVIFVSHNMDSVRRLCERVMWVDEGKIRQIGETHAIISDYLTQKLQQGGRVAFDPPLKLDNGMPLGLLSAQLSGEDGTAQQHYSAREPIRVDLEWQLTERLYKPRIGFVLLTADGLEVLTAIDAVSWGPKWLEPGRYISSCSIPGQLLNEGRYVLDFSADAPRQHAWAPGRTGGLIGFEIEDDMTLPNKYYGQEGFRDARWPGVLLPNIPWTQKRAN